MASCPLPLLSAAGERHGGPVRPAPPFLLLFPNNPIDSSPEILKIQLFSLSCWWPNCFPSRSVDFFVGSLPAPVMEDPGALVQQNPCSWSAGFTAHVFGVEKCREIKTEVWGRYQVWGSVDPLYFQAVISSASFCTVSHHISPLLVVSSREHGAMRSQSPLVIRRSGVTILDGCCSVPELHVRCSFDDVSYSWKISNLNLVTVEINFFMVLRSSFHEILLEQRSALKLGLLRGVNSIKCECILCILETRLANEHAEDGDSQSFGLIRRWQVREPLLLIPRFDGQERFLLGSVKRLQDLQPNIPNLVCICPLDCWESRWLYGWLALSRPVEDSSCGFASVFSTDLSSDSSCSLPRLRLDVFTVLVTKLYKNALAYALFMRVV